VGDDEEVLGNFNAHQKTSILSNLLMSRVLFARETNFKADGIVLTEKKGNMGNSRGNGGWNRNQTRGKKSGSSGQLGRKTLKGGFTWGREELIP